MARALTPDIDPAIEQAALRLMMRAARLPLLLERVPEAPDGAAPS